MWFTLHFAECGASLGRIKSQRHSVMLHTGLAVLFEKCPVFKVSLLNCPTLEARPEFITSSKTSSEKIAGLSFSSFFSKTQRLRSSDIISTKFSEGNSKIYLHQKSKYSLVQIFLMSIEFLPSKVLFICTGS